MSTTKFAPNQFVTFEIAVGQYVPGVIQAVSEDGKTLWINDSDGKEWEINTAYRDVVVV